MIFNSDHNIIEILLRAEMQIIKGNFDLFQYIYTIKLAYRYEISITKTNKSNCFQIDISAPPSVKSMDRIFLTPDGPRIDDPTKDKQI